MSTKYALTSNLTGSVRRYGVTDFTGTFNPADFTQYVLNDSTSFVSGVATYYHKVVAGDLVEMTAPEKAAVDDEIDARHVNELKYPSVVQKVVPNLAALPVPPPKMGVIVGVQNIGGSRGFVISTGVDYLVFVSDGTHP